MAQENKKPKLTVISPSLNTGRFLRETIRSIFEQSYKNFEYIVIDGGSTDETLAILREHPQIKWISEKDNGIVDAIRKGLVMARGDYLMCGFMSDSYRDKDWFLKCVEVLDNDKEVSLVWANTQNMTEEGQLIDVTYFPQFRKSTPPQKTEFIYAYLSFYGMLPEANFCIRKKVFEKCFPQYDKEEEEPFREFNYNFNTKGYLPYFIPPVASFVTAAAKNSRGQKEIESGINDLYINNHIQKVQKYKRQLISRKVTHCYRDGKSRLLPYKFSFLKLLLWRIFFLPTSLIVSMQLLAKPILRKSPRAYKIGRKIFKIFYRLRDLLSK